RRGRLPWFGFAVGPVTLPAEGAHPWRQTSNNNSNADYVLDEAVPDERRVVTIGRTRIGVLVCGELFNWRARRDLAKGRPSLVVGTGHSSMGQGLIPAMQSMAGSGACPVAHSHHLANWYGRSLHFVNGTGEQQSIEADEKHLISGDSVWAVWACRNC